MFEDRKSAGLLLAQRLNRYKGKRNVVILGIPRGGVSVAKVISTNLEVPLDVVVTKKIGAPAQEELAIGAIGPAGVSVFDNSLIKRLGVGKDYINEKTREKSQEIEERLKKFRGQRKPVKLKGKTVILVDDGIATGATVEAAIKYLKTQKPDRIVLVVPVAPQDSVDKLKRLVDELIVLKTPPVFYAVGQFYKSFPQVTDEEVVELLQND